MPYPPISSSSARSIFVSLKNLIVRRSLNSSSSCAAEGSRSCSKTTGGVLSQESACCGQIAMHCVHVLHSSKSIATPPSETYIQCSWHISAHKPQAVHFSLSILTIAKFSLLRIEQTGGLPLLLPLKSAIRTPPGCCLSGLDGAF